MQGYSHDCCILWNEYDKLKLTGFEICCYCYNLLCTFAFGILVPHYTYTVGHEATNIEGEKSAWGGGGSQ